MPQLELRTFRARRTGGIRGQPVRGRKIDLVMRRVAGHRLGATLRVDGLAFVGIRIKDTWTRNPSFKDRPQMVPIWLPPVTAPAKYMPPVTAKPFSEPREHRQVSRHGVISVAPLATRFSHAPTCSTEEAFQVRTAEVCEPEERECLRLSLASLPPIGRCEAPDVEIRRRDRRRSGPQSCPLAPTSSAIPRFTGRRHSAGTRYANSVGTRFASFRGSIARPADSSIYASPYVSRGTTQDSRPE